MPVRKFRQQYPCPLGWTDVALADEGLDFVYLNADHSYDRSRLTWKHGIRSYGDAVCLLATLAARCPCMKLTSISTDWFGD